MSDYIRKTARWNGKKYEATGKTELEAMSKLAEKLAAAKRGEDLVSGAMTVSAWYKQWIDLYKKPKGLTEKSLKMYDEKFNGYIRPAIGHMKLKDVKDVHLQRILNSQAGRSASHVKKIRMVLQEMFKRARQSRLIPYDPAELLELPTVKQGRRRSITEEERAAILAVAERHRAGLWILTLLYTGMRPGETAALTWSDVDFDHNEIHVHAAKESGNRTIKGPKTASGVRDIPIHAALLPRLLAARGKPFSLVFPTKAGTVQNESSMRRMWNSFRTELDLQLGAKTKDGKIVESVVADDLTPYCLRHTFCTDLQRAGVPINNAKELMGHADIQTTANIYTHRDNATLHNSIALLDGSGGKPGGNVKTG
nr:MAG TPA: Integrase [Caudoviricetes sp.]